MSGRLTLPVACLKLNVLMWCRLGPILGFADQVLRRHVSSIKVELMPAQVVARLRYIARLSRLRWRNR
jgi:hypothetical protein